MMNIEELNCELQLLADEERKAKVEMQYDEMMQEMYQLWELEQYAADCADQDAIYYGVR